MSKKKGFRTVVATVIVTLVILAALSYATLKYIAPAYQLNQNKIYQVAVKVFPLILGITLIAIASVLASGSDEEDEDDKLPPNSYDASLFDEPKDDPTSKADVSEPATDNAPSEPGDQEDAPFVSVFETYSKDEENAPENVEATAEDAADETTQEETEKTSEETPAEADETVDAEEVEEASEPETAEAETETEAEEERVEEQPKEDLNKPLIDAIKALSDKIDDFAAAVVYGTEDNEEDEDDEEYYDGEEEEDPIYEGLDRIEAQLEKLTQTISQMSDNLLHGSIVVAPQPVEPAEQTQQEEAEEAVEETVETIPEPAAPATPIEPVQPVEASSDNTGNMLYRSYEGSDAKQKAMAEYDSAKEFGYDLTIALVDLSLSQVALALGEIGDFVDVDGKTLAIIPFADEEEVKSELDKLEATYKSNTYTAGSDMDFDELASGIVE